MSDELFTTHDSGLLELDTTAFEVTTETVKEYARQEQQRIEYAIRGAILAGYDGVDVHDPIFGMGGPHPQSELRTEIEPWHAPPPEADNGRRTTRYTWDWFDEDTLTEIARTGEIPEGMVDAE